MSCAAYSPVTRMLAPTARQAEPLWQLGSWKSPARQRAVPTGADIVGVRYETEGAAHAARRTVGGISGGFKQVNGCFFHMMDNNRLMQRIAQLLVVGETDLAAHLGSEVVVDSDIDAWCAQ